MKCKKCNRRREQHEFAVGSEICMACVVKAMDKPPEPVKKKRPKMPAEERKRRTYLAQRAWVERNREKSRAYQREYYAKHYKGVKKDRGDRTQTPEQKARHLANKKRKRFESPIRYCKRCKRHMKKEHFDLLNSETWRHYCRSCTP